MQDNLVGQNIIITEKISVLRQLGRNALRGKWSIAILACVIYTICTVVPPLIFDNFFGYNPANLLPENTTVIQGMDPEDFAQLYNSMPKYSILTVIYKILVAGPFSLGLSLFFLALFRGHDVRPKDVFLGFERFGKALGLFLYMNLFIILWTMLFIIPGIIATIRYSQAFFVLADDPKKSIRDCMNESKSMMKGNKATYFLMNLSFIGWYFLAAIPAGIVTSMSTSFSEHFVMILVTSLVAELFLTPVYAYIYSAQAGFYEILAGHLIKDTAPSPVTAEQIDVAAPIEHIEEVIESVEGNSSEGSETPSSESDAPADDASEQTKEKLQVEAKVPETVDPEEGMPKEPSIDFKGILEDDNIQENDK